MSKAGGSRYQAARVLFLRRASLVVILMLLARQAGFAQSEDVRPVDWSRFSGLTGVSPGDTFGQDLTLLVQKESGYLYTLIHATYPIEHYSYFGEAEGYKIDTAHLGDSVRTLAHFAWGNAVMINTGVFDPTLAGVPQDEALHRTELAIRGVAMTHVSNSDVPKSYHWGQGVSGRSWQAAYWASRGAQAGWMLWDSMSAETRQAVATMVKYEADAFIDYTVPYWRTRTGTPVSPGDSKAEENAWNSRVLTIAQAMLPDDPNVDLWRHKASELMIGSYSRQSDIDNTMIVDGQEVGQWLNGYNTFNDGILVNHGIIHPDYVTCHTLTYDTLVDTTLARQYIPASAFFNDQLTWDAVTELNFVAGTNPYGASEAETIVSPGGTVFHRKPDGSLDPVLYFPNGNDWSYNPAVDGNYLLFLIYGHVRGLDVGQSAAALDWAAVEIEALEALQNRPGHTGNLYQAGDWNGTLNTIEADAYRELTETWLVHWLDQHELVSPMGAWGELPAPPIPGDFDGDGDVDARFGGDLYIFQLCRTGAATGYDAGTLPPGCPLTPDNEGFIAADFDKDGDVDQDDFGILQRCFSGSQPGDPHCAD